MVGNAQERKAQLATLNEGGGMLSKLIRDTRVTRVGALLRLRSAIIHDSGAY